MVSALDGGRLEAEYQAALDAYVDRVESFAYLPEAFGRCMADERHDYAAHGLAVGEWREYLQAVVEHIAEGDELAALASERLDRIRRRERDRTAKLDAESLRAELQALSVGKPTVGGIQDGESVRESIMRRESYHEQVAAYAGRVQGMAVAVDGALRGGIPDAPRPGRRTA